MAASATPDFNSRVQFFSGLYLLQGTPGLSGAARSQRFGELEAMTGIDAKTAQQLISQYRTDPAGWRTLCDSVTALITRMGRVPPGPAPSSRPIMLQKAKRR